MPVIIVVILSAILLILASKQYLIKTATLSFIAIAITISCWIPPYEADLYQHYQFLSDISDLSLADLLLMRHNKVHTITSIYTVKFVAICPAFSSLVKLISFLGDRKLLPLFILSFILLLRLFICVKFGRKERVSSAVLLIGILLLLFCENMMNLTGLRNPLAFTIVGFAVYLDFIHKKRLIAIGLYILSCLIHPASLLIFAIRFLFYFFKSLNNKIMLVILLTSFVFISSILSMLSGLGGYVATIIDSHSGYLVHGSIVESTINKLFVTTFYIIFSYFVYKAWYLTHNQEMKELIHFIAVILIFNFLNFFNYDVYVRFKFFYLTIAPIFILYVLKKERLLYREKYRNDILILVAEFAIISYNSFFSSYLTMDSFISII